MTPLVVEATYENGALKVAQPLPLREHAQVRVTIEPKTSWADATSGILGWKGSHEELEQILAEAEELENLPVQTDKAGLTGSASAIPRHDPALIEPAATDPARAASPPTDEPSDFADGTMLDIWLNVPPSSAARTVVARHAPLPLPDPPDIPPDDDDIG